MESTWERNLSRLFARSTSTYVLEENTNMSYYRLLKTDRMISIENSDNRTLFIKVKYSDYTLIRLIWKKKNAVTWNYTY